jgi:hypothetical protein
MYAKDWNTGAFAVESYTASGAASFIGLQTVGYAQGFFTGLMTEWYHSAPYYNNEAKVDYTDSTFALSAGIMRADEITVSNRQTLFGQGASYTFQIPLLAQGFSTNGISAYANAYQFITGQINVVPLTAIYGVVGGGSGYSAPTLTYTFNSGTHSVPFTVPSLTFYVDSGSKWSFSNPLFGSTSSERWQTNAPVSGTVSSPATINPVYYHQYSITVSYSTTGGGTPSTPAFTSTSFGSSNSIGLSSPTQNFWADSGPYSLTNPLGGSTSTERWFAQGGQGTISGPGTLSTVYNHQFYLAVSGAASVSQWFNSGSTAIVNEPGVYGRNAGTGQRVASYSIDGGAPTSVNPTRGNVTVSLMMNAAHTLNFNSVTQEQVSLDTVSSLALSSITPPPISGDDYWYDSGFAVNVALNGIWGRAAGTGSRLSSYSVNGGNQISVSTMTSVSVLAVSSIS